MAIYVAQIDATNFRRLQKLPDIHIQGPDRENNGRAYSDLFARLQIRPEMHETFFDRNLKGIRNKPQNVDLLAKGDEKSLQDMSQRCLTALGHLVWPRGKDRNWLLDAEELPKGVKLLEYFPPKERETRPGCHDRFFVILAEIWKRMRNNIFEVKPSVKRQKLLLNEADTKSQTPRSRRNSMLQERKWPLEARRLIVPMPVPTMAARSAKPQQQAAAAHIQFQPWTGQREPARPLCHEIAPPRKWSQSEVEEAIQNIIINLEEARKNSHPEMFSQIWDAQMARLVEYEQYEKQQADIHIPANKVSTLQNTFLVDQEGGTSLEHTEDEGVYMFEADADAGMGTGTGTESGREQDTNSIGSLKSDHTPTPAYPSIRPAAERPSTNNPQQPHPHALPLSSNLSTQHPTPTFPLTTYMLSSLPIILTAYITPFSSTTNPLQPYIWPDAPVQSTSYPLFLHGIRLRANVPSSVPDEKLALVLAYNWSDTCRVVRAEADWMAVMLDLSEAARKRVGVWRVRVCCVVFG